MPDCLIVFSESDGKLVLGFFALGGRPTSLFIGRLTGADRVGEHVRTVWLYGGVITVKPVMDI